MNRLRMIRRLAVAPASVTDLIEHVGLSQPLVSWHLGKLRVAGVVETRRNGRETICRLRPDAFDLFHAHERRALGLDETPNDVPVPAVRSAAPAKAAS